MILRLLGTLLILAATLASSRAEENEGPLRVTAPADWAVSYNGKNGIQFYAVIPQPKGQGVLMFSRWPASGGPEDIPRYVEDLAKRFAESAREKKVGLDSMDYKVEPLTGEVFSGRQAVFPFGGGAKVQTMFMLSDGDGLWDGQFTGTKEQWAVAREILQKLRRREP